MTYEEIIQALHDRKSTSVATALDYLAREEACRLLDNVTRYGDYQNARHRALRIPTEGAVEAAREFYAEDITRLLNEPEVLTPDKLLSHRRIAVAWAVAEVLRTNKGGAITPDNPLWGRSDGDLRELAIAMGDADDDA